MTENKCPQCGAPLEPGEKICRYCGESLPPVQQAQNAAPYGYDPARGPQQQPYQQPLYPPYQGQAAYPPPPYAFPMGRPKRKITAGILGVLLGGLGIHKFYLGRVWMGLLYLLFCWTAVPALLGLIEGIIYLCCTEEQFQYKYVR